MSLRIDRAEQIRQILNTRGLTLYRVSQLSAEIFGSPSKFHVPHNLYHSVADPSLIPTIHQMLALSHITNYRLYDWLAVFGFELDHISRLQLLVPRRQTTLLDSSVYDEHAWIPWFADKHDTEPVWPIAPVGQYLVSTTMRRAGEILASSKRRFLYCRVGQGDTHAFPHLAPGSVVRVDERRSKEVLSEGKRGVEGRIFLVENSFGLTCSQLVFLEKDRIMLPSPERPCQQLEFGLGREARILGLVDAEIRPMTDLRPSQVTQRSAGLPKPLLNVRTNPRDLLRHSRLRERLSFREASAASRQIAGTLADELYFAAPSTLSDYETLSDPPRHIQKIISLCVLYCIDFQEFLRSCGLPLDRDGRDPIPDELVPRQVPNRRHAAHITDAQQSLTEQGGFLDSLLNRWEEVPLFLRHSLNKLSGLKNFSRSDVFWVGSDQAPIHPLLKNAALVVVNRRVKNPAQSQTACEPPLCVILRRDGTYLCGSCTVYHRSLLVRFYSGGRFVTRQFRNGIDAEVIGQVTMILRRLA